MIGGETILAELANVKIATKNTKKTSPAKNTENK